MSYPAGTYRKGDQVRQADTPKDAVQAVWEGFTKVEDGDVPQDAQESNPDAPDLPSEGSGTSSDAGAAFDPTPTY